jgi:hypothetical protein
MTPADFRQFARDCQRWADQARNPSHRQIMTDMARTWMQVAMAVERNMGLMEEIDQIRHQPRLRSLMD